MLLFTRLRFRLNSAAVAAGIFCHGNRLGGEPRRGAVPGRVHQRDLLGGVPLGPVRGSTVPLRECQSDDEMLVGMQIKPSGDVDHDFAAMMIPHHQGAIDLAIAVLRYGRNAQIRRLAQEIIVTQQQEIAAMRLAGEPLPPSVPSPTRPWPRPALDVRMAQ